ncbi:hypothetical protein CFK40_10440 [Virgibacillus necropolis]|uniref:Uncharacterized protein n=1 Tax=Virgibacillus necropolis TaxID=163877 RepID=A0A221MCV4_9BACI|nr:alpha/beta hydrolase [Virgibacillus necropolis]ASN05399.1 hypothetical protein CFK40_10440 [Virgibacillus necropolis]
MVCHSRFYLHRLNENKIEGLRDTALIWEENLLSPSKNGSLECFQVLHSNKEITCPTLVAGGHHDWVCPVEDSVLMAEKIPDSELVIFEKSSHNIFVDEYERFNEEVSSFVYRRFGGSLLERSL